MRRLYLMLAISGGIAGGLVSRYFWPIPAQAQSQVPREIRAQRFVLQDTNGTTFGVLSIEPSARGPASGTIQLFDGQGRETWSNPVGGFQRLNR